MAKQSDADIRARLTALADKVEAIATSDLDITVEAMARLLPNVGITRADLYAMVLKVKAEKKANG
jgi:hypothetical protein